MSVISHYLYPKPSNFKSNGRNLGKLTEFYTWSDSAIWTGKRVSQLIVGTIAFRNVIPHKVQKFVDQ